MLKNITLSADERIIHKAREQALKQHISLNLAFREWLAQYAAGGTAKIDYDTLMQQLNHIKVGKHFSRDDLNER